MEKISIELPVQTWNIIINMLGRQPYADVFEIIAEIKRQGDAAAAANAVVDHSVAR